MKLEYTKNEILETILDLKDYDDPKLKQARMRLEHALNKKIIEELTSIAYVGQQLGYNSVQRLLKDVGDIVNQLEAGDFNWKK